MWDYPEILRGALGRDERLIWSGQPKGGILFRQADLIQIPFSIFWLGFALFWFASASPGTRGVSFFSLFGVPFMLIGVYMLVGRFAVDAWRRSKTYYGLTNERALIARDLFGQSITSVDLAEVNEVTLSQRGDGRGTITFGPGSAESGWSSWQWGPRRRYVAPPAFEAIEQAADVCQQVRSVQKALRKSPVDE